MRHKINKRDLMIMQDVLINSDESTSSEMEETIIINTNIKPDIVKEVVKNFNVDDNLVRNIMLLKASIEDYTERYFILPKNHIRSLHI